MSTASSSLVSPSPFPSIPSTPPQNPHLLNSAPHTLLSLYSRGNPSAVIALSPCLIQTTPVSETTGYIQELNGDAHYVTHDYHQASSAYLHAINIHSSLPSSAASLTSKSYCFFKSALCTIATFPHIPAHLTPANVAASMEILEDEVLPMLERIPPGHLTASMCLLFARLLNLKYGAIPASQAPSRLKTLFINAIALDPYITLEITADEIAKHLDQDEAIAALQQGQEVVRARAERKAAVKTELTVANGPCQQKELQILDDLASAQISSWYHDAMPLIALHSSYPNSLPLLHAMVKSPATSKEEKIGIFEQMRKLSPTNITAMDEYAFLLARTGKSPCPAPVSQALSSLSYELLRVSAASPIPWTAMALFIISPLAPLNPLTMLPSLQYPEVANVPPQQNFCPPRHTVDSTQDGEQVALALSFVEKSLALSPTPTAFLVRAQILLRSPGRERDALVSLKKCAASSPPDSLREALAQGTVTCLLKLNLHREALASARSTEAVELVGICMSHMGAKYRAKAKEELREGLGAGGVVAGLCLAQLFIAEGLADESREVLQNCMGAGYDWWVHTKLGVVSVLAEQLDDALTHYHTAIATDGAEIASEEAREGLELLEKGDEGEGEENGDMDMEDEEGY